MKKITTFFILLILLAGCTNTEEQKEGEQYTPLSQENADFCSEGSGCDVGDTDIQVGLEVGDQIPNLTLTKISGEEVEIYDLITGNDKFILNFSTDWCSDCQREKEKMEEFYTRIEGDDFTYNENKIGFGVVYIQRDSNNEQVKTYLEENNFSFPTFFDVSSTIQKELNVYSVPYNVVLDENGIIKSKSEEIDFDNLIRENNTELEI